MARALAALFLLLLLLFSALAPPVATAQSTDPLPIVTLWTIPDAPGKYLHVLGGLMTGLAAAGLVEALLAPTGSGDQPLLLPVVAISAAVLAGIGKEVLDAAGFGDPRIADVFMTTAGGLAAAGAAAWAETLFAGSTARRANVSSYLLSSAVLTALPVAIGFAVEIGRNLARRAASPRPRGARASWCSPSPGSRKQRTSVKGRQGPRPGSWPRREARDVHRVAFLLQTLAERRGELLVVLHHEDSHVN